jgi:hypothetical protein
MRVLLGLIALGAASWLCFVGGSHALALGEGAAYIVWFGLLSITGLLAGYLWPRSVVWSGLLITWLQSAFLYERLLSAGEIHDPSSATGGKAGWAIVTTLLVAFSPIPALASWLGRSLRGKPAHHDAAADDRPRAGDRGSMPQTLDRQFTGDE